MLVAFVPTHEMGLSDLERRVYEPSQLAPRTRGTHVERHAYGSGGDSSVNDTPLLRVLPAVRSGGVCFARARSTSDPSTTLRRSVLPGKRYFFSVSLE